MNKCKVLAVAVLTCTAVGLTACEKKTEEKSATPPAAETTPAPTAETPATPPAPAAETPAATPAPAETPAAPATPTPEEKKSDAAPAPAPSSTETAKTEESSPMAPATPAAEADKPARGDGRGYRSGSRAGCYRDETSRGETDRSASRPMRNLRMMPPRQATSKIVRRLPIRFQNLRKVRASNLPTVVIGTRKAIPSPS